MQLPIATYSALQQPAAMSEDGNVAVNWREWKSCFDYYLIAAGKENAASREKCALFLHIIWKYGREILEELDLDEKSKRDYDVLVGKFEQHCDPARNINFKRHLFLETCQGEDSFDKFLANLKLRSKTCDFGSLRGSLILTQLIRGIKNPQMRERLLSKTKLSLDEAIAGCRAAESAHRQAEACGGGRGDGGGRGSDVTSAAPTQFEQLARSGGARGFGRARGRRRGAGVRGGGAQTQQQSRVTYIRVCECTARNVQCYRCDRVGHFAKM